MLELNDGLILEFKITFHKLVPKCPDTSSPVPKCLTDISELADSDHAECFLCSNNTCADVVNSALLWHCRLVDHIPTGFL